MYRGVQFIRLMYFLKCYQIIFEVNNVTNVRKIDLNCLFASSGIYARIIKMLSFRFGSDNTCNLI